MLQFSQTFIKKYRLQNDRHFVQESLGLKVIWIPCDFNYAINFVNLNRYSRLSHILR